MCLCGSRVSPCLGRASQHHVRDKLTYRISTKRLTPFVGNFAVRNGFRKMLSLPRSQPIFASVSRGVYSCLLIRGPRGGTIAAQAWPPSCEFNGSAKPPTALSTMSGLHVSTGHKNKLKSRVGRCQGNPISGHVPQVGFELWNTAIVN